MKKLLSLCFKLLGLLNRILYKKPNRIVLYSNLGFRDNVKAIYDYLIEHNYNNKYEIICSINDHKDYKNVSLKNVKFTNNYIGIIYFLTSKYFMYSFGKYPIKPSKKQEVLNLWHGSPLKKIGNLEKGKEHIDYNYFSHILATSEFFSNIMKQAFNCNDDQVIICGQPRNDALFKEYENKIKTKTNLIVWLPTFRSHHLDNDNKTQNRTIPFFEDSSSLNQLNETLKMKDTELIVKLHLRQKEAINDYNLSNIKFYTDEDFKDNDFELYEVLSYSDALITDYSSVYFDFLLLNRPIGFIVDDLEEYSKERGFVFEDPKNYMPGKKIKTIDQFYEFINEIEETNNNYEKDRVKINELVNYYGDENNCERVLDMVGLGCN